MRAETALQEVIATLDTSVEPVRNQFPATASASVNFTRYAQASSELQQLRWMKLAVVKRRKAGDAVVLCSEPIFPVICAPPWLPGASQN